MRLVTELSLELMPGREADNEQTANRLEKCSRITEHSEMLTVLTPVHLVGKSAVPAWMGEGKIELGRCPGLALPGEKRTREGLGDQRHWPGPDQGHGMGAGQGKRTTSGQEGQRTSVGSGGCSRD